jgi:superfamily II DNA or RNA helicase
LKKIHPIKENKIYEDDQGIEKFPVGCCFRISYDSTTNNLILKCLNSVDLTKIIELYSDSNPSYFYMQQYGYNSPKKISIINNFGYFPSGFLFEILNYIKLQYGNLDVVAMSKNFKQYCNNILMPLRKFIKDKSNNIIISNISEDSGRNKELITSNKNPYEYRDYQKKSIEKLFNVGFGRGLVELPTASGKSFFLCNFIYNIIKNIDPEHKIYKKFLLLVPNKQLVSQMYNDFIDYGFDKNEITKFTAGLKKQDQYDSNKMVIIANRQYVFSNKEKLPQIDALIVDEVHQATADVTKNFIDELNCGIKIGCSGSIPRVKYQKWLLNGMFGRIVHSEEITNLQQKGFISKLKLYQIKIIDSEVEKNRNYLFHTRSYKKYQPDENGYSEISFNAAHDAEHEYYEKHYKELYTPALQYVSDFDENTLILFDRIEFGKRLSEMAADIFKGKKIHYIDGSIPVNERMNIVSEMESNGNNILFAEFAVFSTGINVKRLSNLVFVSSSKSFPRILQSIGRTLRLHSSKQESRIIDISFNFKYSQKHLEERMKIYKSSYNKSPDEIKTITI